MPKASRFSGSGKQMKEIALRIQSRMRKLEFTAIRLSEECGFLAAHLQDAEQPRLSRDRIAKILMNCQPRAGGSAALVVSEAELIILSRALKCSVEWLSGQGANKNPIVWNLLTEPERGLHLLHLLEEYEARAGEVVVWSEYPLGSFTTEEFMIAFHRAHFGVMDTQGVTNNQSQLVEFFNKVGQAQRKRVLDPNCSFRFTNLVYKSEVDRIANGEGVYRTISAHVRKRTFEHLASVLTESPFKLDFVIIKDERVTHLWPALQDYETVWVMGELLTLWNYHSGSVGWTEDQRHVTYHCHLLNEMKKNAFCRDALETAEYVKQLAAAL